MESKNKNILCVGEVLWDELPSGAIPGGAPMNAALHLAQLGYTTNLASSVGNDEDGRALTKFVSDAGIDTSLVQVNKTFPTSKVVVTLDKENNATYEIIEPVAWDQIFLTPELKNAAKDSDFIIYGSLASRNVSTRDTVVSILETSNAVRLMDVNFRPPYDTRELAEQLIKYADIVKMNEDELLKFEDWHNIRKTNIKNSLLWFSDYYNKNLICVTRGKNGALVYDKGNIEEHAGFVVNTVDSVGSGDAFLAGFIRGLIEGKNSQETIEYACALGAFVATKSGATPKYDFDAINEILNNGKSNKS